MLYFEQRDDEAKDFRIVLQELANGSVSLNVVAEPDFANKHVVIDIKRTGCHPELVAQAEVDLNKIGLYYVSGQTDVFRFRGGSVGSLRGDQLRDLLEGQPPLLMQHKCQE